MGLQSEGPFAIGAGEWLLWILLDVARAPLKLVDGILQ